MGFYRHFAPHGQLDPIHYAVKLTLQDQLEQHVLPSFFPAGSWDILFFGIQFLCLP